MTDFVTSILLLPFRIAGFLLEMLGRFLAIVFGLFLFGVGALFCLLPPLILIGAPMCLVGAILVFKAL
jgi:hypothetical protein